MSTPAVLSGCFLILSVTAAPAGESFTPDHLTTLTQLYREPALAESMNVRAECTDQLNGTRTVALKSYERWRAGADVLATRTVTRMADGRGISRSALTFRGENEGTVVFASEDGEPRDINVRVAGDALISESEDDEVRSVSRFHFAPDHYWISEEVFEAGRSVSSSVCRMTKLDPR